MLGTHLIPDLGRIKLQQLHQAQVQAFDQFMLFFTKRLITL